MGRLRSFSNSLPKLIMEDQELNIVTYLQKVLEFYAEESNYSHRAGEKSGAGMVAMDRGEQARHALKQVADLLKQQEEMETDFEKLIERVNEEQELGEQNKKLLDELKKLKNE